MALLPTLRHVDRPRRFHPCPTRRKSWRRSNGRPSLFRATPGRRGGLITLDESRRGGDGRRRPPRQHPCVPAGARRRRPREGKPNRHLVLQELIHGHRHYPDEQGDKVAPARRHRLGAQVPVPRPGPPDPGQPRAFRADRPADRQVGRGRSTPCSARGFGTAYGMRRPTRSTRPTSGSSPPSRSPSGPRTGSSSATRSPTRSTWKTSTRPSSRPTFGPPRRWPATARSTRSPGAGTPSPSQRRPLRRGRRRRLVHHRPPDRATRGSARPITARSSSTAPTPIPPTACSRRRGEVTIEVAPGQRGSEVFTPAV